ncbi:BolA/IbaG family iron-sulfur metabolism protein [Alteromonas sp. C1M14]|uniref:BolA family protein n=1 Tax=Alteromonas sp. C1M14 TaxID=2841567 RepID=UPI001C09DFCB|nr:BolA/IbaG family iron-sulfur metabolism protein [Alteromonas sp. C1M14]MBU2977575.1 BolA/IbaG family iron-sulfur metabolism protein [Alteromonas sp. C1M14]
MQDVKAFIEQQLSDELAPVYLSVLDESHMHNVPDGAQSHFNVTIVSDAFNEVRRVARHQRVNGLVAAALQGPVHALALHTFTPEEWKQKGGSVNPSPNCLGGN